MKRTKYFQLTICLKSFCLKHQKGPPKEMKPVSCHWPAKVIAEGLQYISAEEDKQKRQWVYILTNNLWVFLSKSGSEEISIKKSERKMWQAHIFPFWYSKRTLAPSAVKIASQHQQRGTGLQTELYKAFCTSRHLQHFWKQNNTATRPAPYSVSVRAGRGAVSQPNRHVTSTPRAWGPPYLKTFSFPTVM